MLNRIDTIVKRLAKMIDKNTSARHLFFLLATLTTLFFMGYYFGTFDQSSHIPFLKKTIDSSLYPNDQFFGLRKAHYSYFWFFFIPFYKAGILSQTMFIVHILTIYATFWMFWKLTKTLFNSPLTSFLVVLAFILPHITFAGFAIFEFSLLNRTFILPFILFACDRYFNKKYLLSFFLLGLFYNIHVISVNFILAFFLFDSFLRRRQEIRNIIKGLAVFIIGALPVFIWKFGNSSIDFSVHQEWFKIIERSLFHHIFFIFSFSPYIIITAFSGISALILFFIAFSQLKKTDYSLIIRNFMYVAIIILVVEIITARFYPMTIIIQSQIIRVGVYTLLFSYLFFINYLVKDYLEKKLSKESFYVLIFSLILLVFPVFFLIFWYFQRKVSNKRLIQKLIFISVLLLFIITMVASYRLNLWRPQINISPAKTPWYQVQLWAKKNTSKDTIFITPPQRWGFYMVEWRVGSERSTVVTLSELLEGAFEPNYISYWKSRFEVVAPGTINHFNRNYFDSVKIVRKAYYSLSKEKIINFAKKYKTSYIVVEKPHHYNFPVVFENKEFFVYSLKNQ